MKIEDLKDGMDNITISGTIDYIPQHYKGKDWGIVYVKDETKDIRMVLTGETMKKAEEGMKVKVNKGYVSVHRNELQLNPAEDEIVELTAA
ncbi:MAG: hypothetical protein KKF44_04440 [Nanoarchaeota archaeon]|nr:hypothetical protein [Nanoarchaeota archaeon]